MGPYKTAERFLMRTRDMRPSEAAEYLNRVGFSGMIRISNWVNRRKIIADWNYAERRNGKLYVSNTLKNSSLVPL